MCVCVCVCIWRGCRQTHVHNTCIYIVYANCIYMNSIRESVCNTHVHVHLLEVPKQQTRMKRAY